MRCRYSDTALLGRFQVYRVQELNVVGCQQLTAHALVLRPSTTIIISELQNFVEIITLSMSVSVAATIGATVISLPVGTALAVSPFRGRRSIVVLINAFFGLPPVVVGLILYLTLSRVPDLWARLHCSSPRLRW